jgi:signal transduction histidine kinase
VARHSGASEARIEFRLRGKNLYLEVSDDGHGFDAAAPCVGNGLASMRQRVSGLGGVLKIEKCGLNGRGITLSATFLLK